MKAMVAYTPLLRSPVVPIAPLASLLAFGEQNALPDYRSDIDGLRAIAILAVVGYHLFPGLVPGGFVGVDVFFVISGFLISTIIFKSLRNNSFSFTEFYVRRVRRIFPALILILAACLFLGWNTLLINEFLSLGKHVAASAGFVQNVVLWNETGYFDLASELKPLNHLWSLAIEEQFYLAFPFVLWCAWRARVNLFAVIAVIGAFSFAINIYSAQHDPIGNFFSLQTRAWELMVGAAVAWGALNQQFKYCHTALSNTSFLGLRLNSLVSCIGVVAILIAIFGLDKSVSYPGVLALVPVLGAALLLLSGKMACTNRLILSNRLAVFIGLISYPLYLWHWPLLSYLTIFSNGEHPGLGQRAIVLGLSLTLAWLTYRVVEQPVRRVREKVHQRWMVTGLVCAIAALMFLGFNAKHMYPKYDEPTQKIMQAWNFAGFPAVEGIHPDDTYKFSTLGHNDKRKILFFGDSHAGQYQFFLADLLRKNASRNADLPQIMFPPLDGSFPPVVSQELLEDRTISVTVLSYFWAVKYWSEKVNQPIRCCGKGLMGTIGARQKPLTEKEMDQLDQRLLHVVSALRKSGMQVYILLDNPFGEEFSPRFIAKRNFFHGIKIEATPVSKAIVLERAEPVRHRIIQIARQTGSHLIDPVSDLCDQSSCPVLSPDGIPINQDYDHLSVNAIVKHVRYLDFLFESEEAK